MHKNPYAADLGDRDPLQALEATPQRIRHILQDWTTDQFERSYAPGKWTARQVLIHLAQTELALTARARYALGQHGYTAQAFSQDDWIGVDKELDARTALDAYLALRRMNLAMFRSLAQEQRDRTFTHPEYGTLTVWWVANQLAGHDLHHARQLEAIGA